MAEPDPLAELAAQVEDLRAIVTQFRAVVVSWDARLQREGIGATLMIQLKIKQLARRLDEALAKNRLTPPPAPWWVVDREQGEAMLAELREWVDKTLRLYYPDYLARLPVCWPNHPEAVWELSTLKTEWDRVYGDPDHRDLAGALWWHERWLPGVLARLEKAITCDLSGCRRTARPS
jgi:hypothetical protein